jgi:predicted PurR-regulated permease PerM
VRVLPYVGAAFVLLFWTLFLFADAPEWLMLLLWVPMMAWYIARIVEHRRRDD